VFRIQVRAKPSTFTAALIAALIALAPRPGAGGDWHTDKLLVCSDCHTSHNSAGGSPLRYDNSPDPAQHLLRGADEVSLCLACHDGANPRAPDVLAPVGYVANPAGGAFSSRGGEDTGTAHDLLPPTPVLVPSGDALMVLTCSSCHDPHGNGNYRNLRNRPGGQAGTGTPVVVDQTKIANGSNPTEVYPESNLKYRSGVSQWCLDCHTQIDVTHSHPYDRPISGSFFASYTTWSSVVGVRVPVQSPTDPAVPSTDDQVFCLSCHKAHGTGNPYLLRFVDEMSLDSTCIQCHDQ
jgi:predicted CXXCH cytochrome family protein